MLFSEVIGPCQGLENIFSSRHVNHTQPVVLVNSGQGHAGYCGGIFQICFDPFFEPHCKQLEIPGSSIV